MSTVLKEEVTVWKNPTDNQPLLEPKGDGRYYVPLSYVNGDKLDRLCVACAYAIKEAGTGETLRARPKAAQLLAGTQPSATDQPTEPVAQAACPVA